MFSEIIFQPPFFLPTTKTILNCRIMTGSVMAGRCLYHPTIHWANISTAWCCNSIPALLLFRSAYHCRPTWMRICGRAPYGPASSAIPIISYEPAKMNPSTDIVERKYWAMAFLRRKKKWMNPMCSPPFMVVIPEPKIFDDDQAAG